VDGICLICKQIWCTLVGDRERLTEENRDLLMSRCYPANQSPTEWIGIYIDCCVKRHVNQVHPKSLCSLSSHQMVRLASKYKPDDRALLTNPNCAVEHSDPVLDVSVLTNFE
jgi:hypothetical protein